MIRLAIALLLCSVSASAAERTLIAERSEIGFSVKQMGVAVSGRFTRFTARIDLDPGTPEKSSAEISVDVASIDTGSEEGDETAVDQPWLDAAGFPKATFKSTSVRALGADRYEARGPLTIKGKPREVTVPFTLKRAADGTATVAGDFQIRRTDFGVGGGEWNEDDLVANDIPIRFRLTLKEKR